MNKAIVITALLAAMVLSSCSSSQCPFRGIFKKTPHMIGAGDPIGFCGCMGTVDSPVGYSGEKIPDLILPLIKKTMKLPDDSSPDYIRQTTFWRCMDSKVFVCMTGANLPCMEKADLSKTPSDAMKDYCSQNPGQDFIPAYVTGRSSVYDWACSGQSPVIERQIFRPDKRGFISEFWFELETQG